MSKREAENLVKKLNEYVENEVRYIFLCGGSYTSKNNNRYKIKKHLEKLSPKNFIIYPEIIHNTQYKKLQKFYMNRKNEFSNSRLEFEENLVDNENLYYYLTDKTIVVAEGNSSYSELGAFTNLTLGEERGDFIFLSKTEKKTTYYGKQQGIMKKNSEMGSISLEFKSEYNNCIEQKMIDQSSNRIVKKEIEFNFLTMYLLYILIIGVHDNPIIKRKFFKIIENEFKVEQFISGFVSKLLYKEVVIENIDYYELNSEGKQIYNRIFKNFKVENKNEILYLENLFKKY